MKGKEAEEEEEEEEEEGEESKKGWRKGDGKEMEIMARGKKRSSFFFENEIDGRTDGRTNLLIEMCGRIQKYNNNDNDNTMTMKTTTTTNLEHEGEFQRFVKSA